VTNVIIAMFAASSGLLAIGAVDLRRAGIYVICLILAVAVHEFSHAFAAHRLGDGTPEGQGRLTLNPLAHMDPVGTLALPLILSITSPGLLFGWGRPVETQPRNYTRKVSMRAGMAIVAFAGPLSNLLLSIVTLGVIWALVAAGVFDAASLLGGETMHPAVLFYTLNIVLFVFNLLPLHPLDGGKMLAWLLPAKYDYVDEFLTRYGGLILVGLVVAGGPILGAIFSPFFRAGMWALRAVL
jgi:Zn-dependent protease